MNRSTPLAMTTTALLCLAVSLSSSDSLAQQKSLKDQLVGTWTLVSSDQVRPDGSKLKQFGANPKGINVFDANGRFFLIVASSRFLVIASADNTKIASYDPSKTNSEEIDSLIVEPMAYYGWNRWLTTARTPSTRRRGLPSFILRPAHSRTRSEPIKNELSPLSRRTS